MPNFSEYLKYISKHRSKEIESALLREMTSKEYLSSTDSRTDLEVFEIFRKQCIETVRRGENFIYITRSSQRIEQWATANEDGRKIKFLAGELEDFLNEDGSVFKVTAAIGKGMIGSTLRIKIEW